MLRLGTTGEDAEVTITGKRCAEVAGFNVRANTGARMNERDRLETLVKYLARPVHVVRYHGILGPAAKDRHVVVPHNGPVPFGRSTGGSEPHEIDPSRVPRLGRLPWAVLLKRVFLVDVLECPKCKGRMKLLAAIASPTSVRRVLKHLGLPTEAPKLAPARPPPQLELADGQAWLDDINADPAPPEG